ncbi:pro-FMRFamide-related neuropeptide VF [Triplophysa dalaica]|uniref:pro-FMRFamide-related neuropeptide VF n=1 Tax=Triplophysa dalaica TaxID=1582913 RepID=UPI0024E008F4|nr:pro-FMRFamide-related neuropeptide VF [Triplophysa dalaica]
MSYCILFSLAFGILSSLMLREVTSLRWPRPGDSDPHRFTWGQFPANAQDVPRSLEIEDFSLNIAPTSGRVISPTILRLHPIMPKPSHLHANLPLRFGRDSQANAGDRAPKSTINLPQRFGRSCIMCVRSGTGPSSTLPQRFGRHNLFTVEPFRTLRLLTRSPEIPFPKDRSQVNDYMIETEDSELSSDANYKSFK